MTLGQPFSVSWSQLKTSNSSELATQSENCFMNKFIFAWNANQSINIARFDIQEWRQLRNKIYMNRSKFELQTMFANNEKKQCNKYATRNNIPLLSCLFICLFVNRVRVFRKWLLFERVSCDNLLIDCCLMLDCFTWEHCKVFDIENQKSESKEKVQRIQHCQHA